eukprot:m.62924 g.62924  ORF g.62924 m.62924 type:complete len:708 (+) comp7162_c0_seq1:19-2142(+)
MDFLSTPRCAPLGDAFFVHSSDVGSYEESFNPLLGMYAMPMVAFYGGHFPVADIMLSAHCTSTHVPPSHLPREVEKCLAEHSVSSYEFFWNIFNVSSLTTRHGNRLNLVNHAWLFQTDVFSGAPKFRKADLFHMGAFTYEGSYVQPSTPTCLPFQCLDPLRVSVHTQAGGMCCSPNNARFMLIDSTYSPVSFMWNVVVRKGPKPTACVSLTWMLRQDNDVIRLILRDCRTLSDVLDRLPEPLHYTPSVVAMNLAFGRLPRDAYGPVLSAPARCERKQPVGRDECEPDDAKGAKGGGAGGKGKQGKGGKSGAAAGTPNGAGAPSGGRPGTDSAQPQPSSAAPPGLAKPQSAGLALPPGLATQPAGLAPSHPPGLSGPAPPGLSRPGGIQVAAGPQPGYSPAPATSAPPQASADASFSMLQSYLPGAAAAPAAASFPSVPVSASSAIPAVAASHAAGPSAARPAPGPSVTPSAAAAPAAAVPAKSAAPIPSGPPPAPAPSAKASTAGSSAATPAAKTYAAAYPSAKPSAGAASTPTAASAPGGPAPAAAPSGAAPRSIAPPSIHAIVPPSMAQFDATPPTSSQFPVTPLPPTRIQAPPVPTIKSAASAVTSGAWTVVAGVGAGAGAGSSAGAGTAGGTSPPKKTSQSEVLEPTKRTSQGEAVEPTKKTSHSEVVERREVPGMDQRPSKSKKRRDKKKSAASDSTAGDSD